MKTVDEELEALFAEKPVAKYTCTRQEGIQQKLLCWLARGKTLRAFCRRAGSPKAATVEKWRRNDPVFADDFLQAVRLGSDMLAQECLDIADSGGEEDVKHRRLQIETRLKLLAKWDARYGDSRQVTVNGQVNHTVEHLSETEVTVEVMRLLALAKTRQLQQGNRIGVELLN